ncbi:c-type cytochrome [Rhodospirillum sp. A1_3_36]|uniref:c-type cytochrome n=1 Tax=Rhodospirillum sp. A1_3_36 TaxID=3391666 RepID=UPI0039A5C138
MHSLTTSTKKRLLVGTAGIAILGCVAFFALTSPTLWSLTHPSRDTADSGPADLENGQTMFIASDCATCHATPGQDDKLLLGGGRQLNTDFGIFTMPNISPDKEHGIGDWTVEEFVRAVREGVGRDGENLYPAFPYTSYQRMTANDLRDLFAYIKTLEPVAKDAPPNDLKFPFNIRRGIGVWRLAFLDGRPLGETPETVSEAAPKGTGAALLERGRYLVEGPGHCAECHSPRTVIGTIQEGQRYGGGVTPEGTGYFPNISPDETGIGYWAVNSLKDYLHTGISPINKRAGGDMAEVIENTSQLSDHDRLAMAVYLKSIPPVDRPAPGQPEPNFTTEVVALPPELTVRKKANIPVTEPDKVVATKVAYTAHTKSFSLDKNNVGAADHEDGKILGASKLNILRHEGDKIEVRLDGWQVAGADSVLYAQQGQRITEAVLSPAAIATITRGASITDPATGQDWTEASVTFWVDTEGLNSSLPNLWQYSSNLFSTSCAVCHALPESEHFLANQWIGTLGAMKRFTSLSDDDYRLLLAYLQNHAKDTDSAHGEGAK